MTSSSLFMLLHCPFLFQHWKESRTSIQLSSYLWFISQCHLLVCICYTPISHWPFLELRQSGWMSSSSCSCICIVFSFPAFERNQDQDTTNLLFVVVFFYNKLMVHPVLKDKMCFTLEKYYNAFWYLGWQDILVNDKHTCASTKYPLPTGKKQKATNH